MNTVQLAASEKPQPANLAKNYDPTNHESFALLLLAVKDWSLGALDDAGTFFEQFQAATPDDANAWLNAYKPIAAKYSADLTAYRSLAESARTASDPDALQKAIEAAKALREKVKQPSPFTEKIAEIETALGKQLAAAEEAKAMKDAERAAAEEKLMAAAMDRLKAAYAAFKFLDAAQALATTATLTDEKLKTERDAWAKRTEWLTRFKATLVSDINNPGYPQPLRRRNGTPIPNGLHRATDLTTEMVTPYGNVPVPWTDLSIESVMIMAQAFLRTAPPEAQPDRQWQLGVFLHSFGKKPEAAVMLHQAAETKPDYQPYLALFPES